MELKMIVKTYEKLDPAVTEFRLQAYTEDFKLPLEYMDLTYTQLKREFDAQGIDDLELFENAWKLSNTKFKAEDIDRVFMVPDAAISCGLVIDDNRYRGGYLSYTLERKRKQLRCFHYKEFGFITMQCLRAIELGKKQLVVYIYEYNRRMTAQVRAYMHKGYSDNTEHYLHKETEYHGMEHVKGVDQHAFVIDFDKLTQKYDPYLMELKTEEENIPVDAKYPTDVKQYPECIELDCDIDLDALINEYNNWDDNENYLWTRRNDLVISPSINAIVAANMGFRSSVYHGVPLNVKGSTDLKESVGVATRELLSQFDKVNRINYITTRTGWETVQHVDHDDYTKQGFRIIVPLTGTMKMTFNGTNEYILYPGKAYFVNICIPHVGEHGSDLEERASLLFKTNDDSIIWRSV